MFSFIVPEQEKENIKLIKFGSNLFIICIIFHHQQEEVQGSVIENAMATWTEMVLNSLDFFQAS